MKANTADDSDCALESAETRPESSIETLYAVASPPFDGPGGDVILRTSDDVDFWVLKAILEFASPVFKDMFSLPQPDNKGDAVQTPIIAVSESSATLDALLRLCYPVERPQLLEQDMSLIGDVLHAAQKYDIIVATDFARRILKSHAKTSGESALAVYAIACTLKLEEEAYTAATECLRWPVLETPVPQLTSMSGMDCYNLLDFHRRAGAVISGLFHEYDFLKTTCSGLYAFHHTCTSGMTCVHLHNGSSTYIYEWWAQSRLIIESSLKLAPLDFERIALAPIARTVKQHACANCKDQIFQGWEGAKEKMIVAIKEKVVEVSMILQDARTALQTDVVFCYVSSGKTHLFLEINIIIGLAGRSDLDLVNLVIPATLTTAVSTSVPTY
ncbi:hypothetical protein ACEPAI_9454 [Sanghuangporus weigelae]